MGWFDIESILLKSVHVGPTSLSASIHPDLHAVTVQTCPYG